MLPIIQNVSEKTNRSIRLLNENPFGKGKIWQDLKKQIWVSNQMAAPRIGFLFPGQGSQQLNMAQCLTDRHDWARDIIKNADQLLTSDGHEPISTIVYRNPTPSWAQSNQESGLEH